MVSVKFVILFILFNSIYVSANSQKQRIAELSHLVEDLIRNERVPSVLAAIICWSKIDEFHFMRNMPMATQILNPKNVIDLPTDGATNKQWFFIDMTCEYKSNFLSTVNEKYFAHPYRWIIADSSNETINDLTFLPDSNIILANHDLSNKEYILKQVYKIGRNDAFIYEKFGYWSQIGGVIDTRSSRIISRRRRDLRGHLLKTSAVYTHEGAEKYPDLDDYNHIHVDPGTKVTWVITRHLVDSTNGTMHTDIQRTWGYKNPKTGEVTGMAGQLQRKEIDIGATPFFMTADRIEYLEFISVTVPTSLSFILRAPPISYVSNIYYLPFTGVVWICSILLVILCTCIIAITLKLHWLPNEETRHMTTSDFVLLAISSTCQMGSEYMSKILSARIALFVFFIALVFMFTAFTANIVALLQSTTKSIRTISDLQNSAIEIGVSDNPYNRHYFALENEPSRKKLYETKIAPPNAPAKFMNISYGVSRIREGMFAFHTENSPGYAEIMKTFHDHEKCGLIEIKFLSFTNVWGTIQKRSPYKEILKVNLMKIREHGIQPRELSRVYRDPPRCSSDGKNFGSVRVIDCYAALLILIYGFLASIIIAAIELVLKSKLSLMYARNLVMNIKHFGEQSSGNDDA